MQFRFGILLLFLLAVVGCGPHLSQSELGKVVFEVPKVAGADEPYPMPQLGPPKDDDPRKHGHPHPQ
jgi:hypothetical protein